MLTTLLRAVGILPQPLPPRPASRRHEIPTPPRPTARPTVATASDREAKAAEARAYMQRRSDARFADEVALLVRTYDPHSTQPSPEELCLAMSRLDEVGHYVTAVYVGGGRLAILPTSQRSDPARTRAYREHVQSLVRTDLDRWEAGVTAADKAAAAAKRYGDPVPPAIILPEDVRAKLDQRALEKVRRLAEQAARRAGGGSGGTGSTGPTGGAAPAAPPALPLAPEGKGQDEEKPEGDEPPAGPKR